ncbi:hypothetical protein Droror1_Dr00023946 [Drosera rotundifolia]
MKMDWCEVERVDNVSMEMSRNGTISSGSNGVDDKRWQNGQEQIEGGKIGVVLREELASAERRAEEERLAHNATRKAFMEREVELEHRAIDASTALAKAQRLADDRTAKVAKLEHKVALLKAECSSLNQELQDMDYKFRKPIDY